MIAAVMASLEAGVGVGRGAAAGGMADVTADDLFDAGATSTARPAAGDMRGAEEDGLPMVRYAQGTANMNAPAHELERLVMAGRLRHGGNPVLRWMASNVAIFEDGGGRIRPDKKRSSERIDGISALCAAIGRASVRISEPVSIYATEKMFII